MCMICAQRAPFDVLARLDQHLDAAFLPDAASLTVAFPGAANPDDAYWRGFGLQTETLDAPNVIGAGYTLTIGQSLLGTIGSTTDTDHFAISLVAGQTYDMRILGFGATPLGDSILRVFTPDGVQVGLSDDGMGAVVAYPHSLDSYLRFTATVSGTYYLQADGFSNETGTYLVTATTAPSQGQIFTVDEIAWQLLNPGNNYFGRPEGKAFALDAERDLTVNLTALTSSGMFLARQALAVWSAYTGITFLETAGSAQIRFDDQEDGAYNDNTYLGGHTDTAFVNVGQSWLTEYGTTLNSYSFEAYLHEIGHALGLGHGGNYNGSASYGVDNYYLNDSVAWTIMSYMNAQNDEFDDGNIGDWNDYVDASFRYMYSPMIADMIAMDYLYGTHNGAFLGNTTYGFGSNTGVTALDIAVNSGALMAMMVKDSGGNDTLDFSQTSANQLISLDAESLSSVLGGRSNLAISRGTVIENAIGGNGHDALYGNEVANRLTGNNGQDSLYGGAGNDTLRGGNGADLLDGGAGVRDVADYSDATAPLRADLQLTFTNTGFAAGDSYIGIEDLLGSAYNDTLVGSAAGNIIIGGNGNDGIWARAGNDSLYGGAGDDILYGGEGADLLDGGAGLRDRVVYHDALIGLRVDLILTATNTHIAAGDSFVGIEDLTGSQFDDILAGTHGANMIWGGDGKDNLYGRQGNDSLYGGAGDDILVGGIGADRLDGGAGTRDRAMYHDAASGLRADLQLIATNTGEAAGDSYFAIEDLHGTLFDDILAGDAQANMIIGGNGNDSLFGRNGADSLYGGDGNDILVGGFGADRLDGGAGARDRALYSDSSTGLRADMVLLATNTGIAAGDSYLGVEDLWGTAHADVLMGDAQGNMIWGDLGADQIYGRSGADTLYGGAGADILVGGVGNDMLYGGAGSDVFIFDTAIGVSNIDRLMDFWAPEDTIRLDDAIFNALRTGWLASSQFTFGAAATLAAHRIIYNQAGGQLLFDADGFGGSAAVHFASLTPGAALTAADILVL